MARRLETGEGVRLLPAAGGVAGDHQLQMGEEAPLLLAVAAEAGEQHLTAEAVQRAGEPLGEGVEVARQRRRVVVEGQLQPQSAVGPQVA